MRNFIFFYQEKEGTTAVISILNNFDRISVVRRQAIEISKWEPFSRRSVGSMPRREFETCLDMIYGEGPADMDKFNSIYTRTSLTPMEPFDSSKSTGFKMRLKPTWDFGSLPADSRLRQSEVMLYLSEGIKRIQLPGFRKFMIRKLKEYNVVVFIAVRQDIFRWALSKYHGDGTGKRGHLQFKVALGKVDVDDLAPIKVDIGRFNRIVQEGYAEHERKRNWLEELRTAGIDVYPVKYESFLETPDKYFGDILQALEIDHSAHDIKRAIEIGTPLKKVHAKDISQYVANHKEVAGRFAGCFSEWEGI